MARVCLLFGLLVLLFTPAYADPLHDAAKAGDLERVQQLVDGGANLDVPLQRGETPLIVAALAGQTEVAELLIARGATVQARNDRGFTALHAAVYRGHLAVVELLMANDFNVNDAENRFRATPLHLAAEDDRKDVAEFLVDKGADLEAKEGNGYTPLTKAGFREHWETARLLIDRGAVCQPVSAVGEWWHNECTKGEWLQD